jgi:hypothetical protein
MYNVVATATPDLGMCDEDAIYTFMAPRVSAVEGETILPQVVSLLLPAMFGIPGSVQFYSDEGAGVLHSFTPLYAIIPARSIDVIYSSMIPRKIIVVVKRLK